VTLVDLTLETSSTTEWRVNLERLVARGELDFRGYPLKLRGGTGSPVRAVATLPT